MHLSSQSSMRTWQGSLELKVQLSLMPYLCQCVPHLCQYKSTTLSLFTLPLACRGKASSFDFKYVNEFTEVEWH
jgi:hypothetical protein